MTKPLVPFPDGTRRAIFVRREKRFRALVQLSGADGIEHEVWTHTNNSGSMLGLLRPGCDALVSPATNPKRKLPWTLEALSTRGYWASVNTLAPNRVLRAAWEAKALPELFGATDYRSEARCGDSRLDACLQGPDGPMWVEAKNVTMCDYGVALFPDAVTERGRKHLRELMRLAAQGARVATFYLVSMADAECFAPAEAIDSEYARIFYAALDAGVEAWPYLADVNERGVGLRRRLTIVRP